MEAETIATSATNTNGSAAVAFDAGRRDPRPFETAPARAGYDYGLAWLLVAGLAWAPFWLGGNRPLAWGVNAIFFPSLALLYEAGLIVRGRRHPYGIKNMAVPAALFVVAVVWGFVQTSAYVPSTLAHPIWGLASDGLGAALPATISVDPSRTLLALTRLLTDASVFWVALQLGRNPDRNAFVSRAIAAVVAVYAAYGIVLAAFFGAAIPFFDTFPGDGYVRSTFVNRNSFATYAGLGMVAVVGQILRLYRQEAREAEGLARFRLNKLIELTGRRGALWVGAALVILVALLGTASRGGILSTAFGLSALLALSATQKRRRRGEQIETMIFVSAVILTAFLVFGDKLVGRLTTSGLQDESRMAVDMIVYRAIMDAPLLGFGYGTFADIFPMYRDQSIGPAGVWDMAHNAYFEVWIGLGLVFGTALMAALGWVALKCLVGAVRRRRDATAPIAATAASLLAGAHAMVDFSLQMEAVALTYMAILGLGLAQADSSSRAVSD